MGSSTASFPRPASSVPASSFPAPMCSATLGPVASSRILKRVPRGSIDLAARKLASIVNSVVTGNDILTWQRLLLFTPPCLKKSRRGGKRWSLASAVNNQIKEELSEPDSESPSHRSRHEKRRRKVVDVDDALASRVASKLEEGDYKGALRLACGSDSIAEHSPATLASLKEKHPDPYTDRFTNDGYPNVPVCSLF